MIAYTRAMWQLMTRLNCKCNKRVVLLNVPLQDVSTATKNTFKPEKSRKFTYYNPNLFNIQGSFDTTT